MPGMNNPSPALINPVGAGLPAMAVGQPTHMSLIRRHRRQASSHTSCMGRADVTRHSETGQGISVRTNDYGHFGGDPFKWSHRAHRACVPFYGGVRE